MSVIVVKNLELHTDVLDTGDGVEALAAISAANVAMSKLEGNPALFRSDPLEYEIRPSSDDEFECVICNRIMDIDDSIRISSGLWCAPCVESTLEELREKGS